MSAKKPPRNGKLASRRAATPSPKDERRTQPARVTKLALEALATMGDSPNDERRTKLAQLLASVYLDYQKQADPAFNAQCQDDFVFHMTDWIHDLQQLVEVVEHPERFTPSAAGEIIAGFLFHATWHIRAAARLLLDFKPEDIFLKLETKVRE